MRDIIRAVQLRVSLVQKSHEEIKEIIKDYLDRKAEDETYTLDSALNDINDLESGFNKSYFAQSYLNNHNTTTESFEKFLPFVEDEEIKFSLAKKYLERDGITTNDFKTILPFVQWEHQRVTFAKTWLKNNEITKGDFKEIISLFDHENLKSNLAKTWLEKDGRTADDFKEILPYVSDHTHGYFFEKSQRSSLVEGYLERDGISTKDFITILPFVKYEDRRLTLAQQWLGKKISKDEITKDDLKKILNLVNSNNSELAATWLQKDERTADDFREILLLISDDELGFKDPRSFLAKKYLERDGITTNDFKTILPFVQSEYQRSTFAKTWLKNNEITKGDFEKIIILFDGDNYKSNLAKTWLEKDGRTKEDLKYVLSLVDDEHRKSNLAKTWLEKNKINAGDLKEIILSIGDSYSNLQVQYYTSLLIKDWLDSNEITKGDFKEIISLFDHENFKYNLAKTWLEKDGRTADDFKEILPYVSDHTHGYYEKSQRSFLAEGYLKRDGITTNDFKTILPFVGSYSMDAELTRFNFAREWLEKDGRTTNDFKEIISLFDHEIYKYNLAKTWFEKDGITADDFKEIISFVDDKYDKSDLAKTWFEKDGITADDFKQIISFVHDEYSKSNLAKRFLKRDGITADDFKEIISFVHDEYSKSNLAKRFLKRDGISRDDLRDICILFGKDSKSDLAKTWLSEKEKRTTEDFAYVAKNDLIGEGRYDVKAIVDTYKNILQIDQFIPLFKDLYEMNYDTQIEALQWVLATTTSEDLQEAKNSFLEYFKDIPSNDKALEFLSNLQAKISISPEELLNATSQHLSNNFQSLAEILQNKNIVDSLTKEGLENFKDTFQGLDPQQVNLASIFSYYNLRGSAGIEEFLDIIKSEILQEIKDNFSPSDCKVLISGEIENLKIEGEMKTLQTLLGNENIQFPLVVEISNVLEKLPIANFPEDKIDEFKFGDSALLALLVEETNEKFRELLKKDPLKVSDVEVANFFKEILKLENDINEKEREPLKALFDRDKFLLANLLVQENGLDKFQKEIETLRTLRGNENIEFPLVAEISNVLEKLTIANFPKDKIDELKFVDSALLVEETNEKFRELLKKDPLKVSDVEVANFFKEILKLENDINKEERKPLKDFFDRDKFLLANLLAQENGLDKFQSAIFSLGHGCYANIGSQVRMAVVDSLIKDDVSKQILFSVFSRDLSDPILTDSRIGVYHPKENTTAKTLFKDTRVNGNYYSPPALVKKIKEEFCKNGKKVRNASDFLMHNYEKFADNVDALMEIAGDAYNETEAELATYFLIKKELPELLNNRYLQGFRERCEMCIEEIEQKSSPSAEISSAAAHNISSSNKNNVVKL